MAVNLSLIAIFSQNLIKAGLTIEPGLSADPQLHYMIGGRSNVKTLWSVLVSGVSHRCASETQGDALNKSPHDTAWS